jgi:hypothetical protein
MKLAWIAVGALIALALAACQEDNNAAPTAVGSPAQSEVPASTAASAPVPERPATLEEYPETVAAYLTAGPAAADTCLLELFAEWTMPLVRASDGCLQANTDNDADLEIVAVFSRALVPPSTTSDTEYVVAVFDREADSFVAAFDSELLEVVPTGAEVLDPILEAGDLNNDGGGEVAFKSGSCGASTCFETAFIYKGTAEAYELVSPQDGISVAGGGFEFRDLNDDGSLELIATGEYTSGSVGAGPQRPRTEVWAWNGASAYVLLGTESGPSRYLYHHVIDADALLDGGDYAQAEQAYVTAAEETEPLLWKSDRNEQAELSAYALFRAALARLVAGGGSETAMAHLDRAKAMTGTLHAQLAASFQAGYAAKSEIGVGCAAVRDDLRANDAEYAAFWDYGYANPTFDPARVCPF